MKQKTGAMSIVLTALSGVAFIGTCVLVAKATPPALERIQKAEEEKGEELTKMEKVKAAAPAYIPSAILGASAIICMAGSTALDKKHQASLSSAIALGNNYAQKYKGKVKELFGVETEKEISESIDIQKPVDNTFPYESWCTMCFNESEDNPGTPMLFYEVQSGTFFEKTLEQVLLAEYHLNRNYILNGEVTLNDWYEYLGLDKTDTGDAAIWTPMDLGDEWIDFNHKKKTTSDGRVYYEISLVTEPYYIDMLP